MRGKVSLRIHKPWNGGRQRQNRTEMYISERFSVPSVLPIQQESGSSVCGRRDGVDSELGDSINHVKSPAFLGRSASCSYEQ
ncbi:hypothetical protein BaRGS_00031333 [Batillaria attramentaria]|uniref:Uncharacterized protein n=1 Tax=Batillaria attramentaria TaxID=370345 RepID=A0ABD0JR92_9CAEN